MTLTDTGPLVALIDADDDQHARCLIIASKLPAEPLLTTWPCYTEAMYLLGEAGGFLYQERLWNMLDSEKLNLLEFTTSETDRMKQLMRKYKDRPMDLADASLIAIAERRGLSKIFTIDGDFHFYRLKDGSVLEILSDII